MWGIMIYTASRKRWATTFYLSRIYREKDELLTPILQKKKKKGSSGRLYSVQFSSVTQSRPTLYDPMNRTHQASLSITNSRSPPKPMSTESAMPSNHLILWRPLLLLPSIFPSIRVFSNESALHIRWPKYWSFIFNIRLYCSIWNKNNSNKEHSNMKFPSETRRRRVLL